MRKITISMTLAEARGLLGLADEGAETLFKDRAAATAYLGTSAQQQAARRALKRLEDVMPWNEVAERLGIPQRLRTR